MDTLQFTQAPVAEAAMLIRRPVTDVFEAFIDPAITSNFWFTRGSGRLEEGKQVQWDWEMYHVSTQVKVLAIEEHKRILVEWSGYGTPTQVEWIFTPFQEHATFVHITNKGFSGNGDEQVKQALSSTEGFTVVLAGLKAFLEHNVNLHLILDRHPAGLQKE
ncbi:MAG TPA: SRPBCC family protein [Ktedonobacteraceae bacterium]|nr:SRPBCC family protein [Ktedonobacteraceae bacterium]